jgi:N-acetylglutamate synthase-like GNAT family acetyltransferase
MVKFRTAELEDIKQIQEIEKEYYEGFNCPEDILKNWIDNLSENFIVADRDHNIIGFIFFEYLERIKAIPFTHKLEHSKKGKYVYISEIGILDEFHDSDVLQKLLDRLIKKSKKDGCETVIWLTGSKKKHDKIEQKILLNNGFVKKENIKNWEVYPDYFVDDHYIWIKEIK